MKFGVGRLQYLFFVLGAVCLLAGVFVELSGRPGILLSAGAMIFWSLHLVCYVVAQDLKKLAERGEEEKTQSEPEA